MNPYTQKPGKMIRVQLHMWPEEKAKLQAKSKEAQFNHNLSAVVRFLASKIK